MDGNYLLSEFEQQPHICTVDGIITKVSDSFLVLTEYIHKDLLQKNISDVFKRLFKSNSAIVENTSIFESKDTFLFTKFDTVKKIKIHFQFGMCKNEKFYIFTKHSELLKNRFPGFYKLLIDNRFSIGIFSCPDLTLLKANQAYFDLLDEPYNCKDVSLGLKISDFIPSWEKSSVRSSVLKVINSGETFYGKEIQGFTSNKKRIYCDITIIPTEEECAVKYIICMIEDVTIKVLARKKLEEQSRTIYEQKEQLEIILENMSDGIFITDQKGRFLKMNAEMRKQHYKPETIKKMGDGFKTTKYFDLDGNEMLKEDMPAARALKGEKVKNFRLRLQRPDKDVIMDTNACPVYDLNENIIMSIVCSRDITDEVNQSITIQEQKELLETVIENISDPLLIFDKNGRYLNINKAAREIYGQDISNILKVGDILKHTDCYNTDGNLVTYEEFPAVRVLKGEKIIGQRMSAQINACFIYIDMYGVPIYDNQDNFIAGIMYIRDVTQKIEYENMVNAHQSQMLKAEKERNEALENDLRMKDEFLSTISHEFKTPLTVINSAIQAMELLCKNELSEKAKGFIKKIHQNSLRQLRLVNNLLDITKAKAERIKINKKNLDIVFLTKAITESVHLYAKQKGIKLTFTSTFGKKIIGIDDEKYERILLNLLSNAIKFTPKGKSITVKVGSDKGYVCIEVKDDGLGIPKDKQELIFERFGQVDSTLSRQAEGTGIGLSLVKLLTEALGGTITVKSKLEKGTTFKLLLPSLKVSESIKETLPEISDNRLIQVTAIEFSDIYLN